MKGNRLYKSEKLCSRTATAQLFEHGTSLMAYPLRAVYRLTPAAAHPGAQMLISVPKRRIRHATGRVLLRRRVREAYRLQRRTLLHPALEQTGMKADIAFVYLSEHPHTYAEIALRMQSLLERIAHAATAAPSSASPSSPSTTLPPEL